MIDVDSYRSEEVFEKQNFIQKAFEKKICCLAEGIDTAGRCGRYKN